MDVRTWEGVAVDVQSALATALVITGITKANPAVVTFTGTPPVNGELVYVLALGMSEVNGNVYKVAGVAGQTFQLAGVDSTLYRTFVSGTAQVATLGVSMTIGRTISGSGGEPSFIDISTIHDLDSRQIPGKNSPVNYSLECFWDPADASLVAFIAAAITRTKRVVKFTWPDGAFIVFAGYVAASGTPTGSVGDVVTTPITFTIAGRLTAYTS